MMDQVPGKKAARIIAVFLSLFLLCSHAQANSEESSDPKAPALSGFQSGFYISHELRLKYPTYDCLDFILIQQREDGWNSLFSVVTGSSDGVLETRILKGIQTVDEAREYFEKYAKPFTYEGVTVQEVTLVNKSQELYKLYFVGQIAFSSLKDAQQAIDAVKKEITAADGDFAASVEEAKRYAASFTGEEYVVEKTSEPIPIKPNFQEEEDIFFGIYDGVNPRRFWGKYPEEDWYVYQAVGETTYRNTNLDSRSFNAQVGYFNNRIVMRGLKFFGSSVDPYIEATVRFETNDLNFNNTVDFMAGAEYRPFRLNKTLANSVWTDWIRNFRVYVIYAQREPIKDIIAGSRDHDVEAGFDYFKEWGIDMPKEGEKDTWLWGELFMDNHFLKTDFSTDDDFSAFIFNNAGKIGFKFPRIPLPKNPINDELVFMPYCFFDQVANSGHSFFYQNRYFIGAGMRVMPFRSYRFLNSQWMFRLKIFGEYIGYGGAQYSKAEPPSSVPDRDYRVGLNISLNRF
ncbi:MAG: hypothetical protein HY586_05895 [Candidatus Omnitrophica bacterium]|nr:hypothetical protein [Candidatus Omnitrophota bacterium]